ncbi:MAG TPA: hypothetical protein DD990_15375 [Cyanobacteria bacterium UBA11368]|nr:hypothetical protein [Cyanobacteria bacterium UBA11368]
MNQWGQAAKDLVTTLEDETDEQVIAELCKELVEEICNQYPAINSRRVPLTTLRKAVSAKFPASPKQTGEQQYFTTSGKGKKPRWEHLALKYLTLAEKDWDALGGGDRANWKATQEQSETTEIQPTTKPQTLTDMNIEQLELDKETQETVEKAVAQSGMSLAEFVKKSLQVYSKTVTGKVRKHEEDLTTVATNKLRDDKEFSTHPGRAEELTKRAIRAMTIHNDEVATEQDQKWCITQTAISELIGARASSVQRAMEPFKTMIDDHNSKHELTAYTNRKSKGIDGKPREIYNEIDLCKLVPDGLS